MFLLCIMFNSLIYIVYVLFVHSLYSVIYFECYYDHYY